MIKRAILSLALIPVLTSLLHAHYPWLAVDAKSGNHGEVRFYFEEAPRPGDGQYLDPFIKNGKWWIRTTESPKPQPLKLSEVKKSKQRWLAGPLSAKAPRVIECYSPWGVYTYGKQEILLHYNARYLDVSTKEDLKKLGRAKQLTLDIIPTLTEEGVELQVLWQGKPAAGRIIYVRGGKGGLLKTNDKGIAILKPQAKGQYLLRTFIELNQKGMHDGKAYDQIRHHCTLSIRLPI